MSRKSYSLNAFAVAGVIAMSAASFCATRSAQAASAADPDGDGSISMQEAHDGAAKKFDKLDTMHTGKLTAKQVSPISKAMTEMARHDKDHAIEKNEYMAGVDAAFQEADKDKDGKLEASELKSPAGKRFLMLVE